MSRKPPPTPQTVHGLTYSQYYAFPEYSVGRYAFMFNSTTNEVEPIVMTITRYEQLYGPFWNHTFLNPSHQIDDEDFDGDFDLVSSRLSSLLLLSVVLKANTERQTDIF